MKWFKLNKSLTCVITGVFVLVPLLLNMFIFNNNYFSKVSNDGWASFLGGYVGAIIGAITTVIVVSSQIAYNEKTRKEDLIRQVRPYLCVDNFNYSGSTNGIFDTIITIKNVGLQAACDTYIYDNDADDLTPQVIYAKHLTLGANEKKSIQVKFNLSKSECYEFVMYDVRGNRYTQELRIETNEYNQIVSMNTLLPQLEKTAEYYEHIEFAV